VAGAVARAAPDGPRTPRRIFFCHLQKTGGTALIRRLTRHFSPPAVYPAAGDEPLVDSVISVRHLLARWQARGDEIRVVTGHFPLCTRDLLGGEFVTLTLLRDPVERTLSFLRHELRTMGGPPETPLETLYEAAPRFQWLVHNHMVKMLSLAAKEMTHGALTIVPFTRDRLETAKQRLAEIDAVGLQEELEPFCQDIAERFDLRLGPPVVANLTRPHPVAQAFRDRIAEDNALDIELYQAATALVAEQRQSVPKG
jgi:hypothetical protein